MESKILTLLQNSQDYISGKYISSKLNVSRTAIWKHINNLKKKGYMIEGISNKGYKLISEPDLLIENSIASSLKTKLIGRNIIHFDSINSTNLKAKELASSGLSDGSLIISEEQSGGSGRLGRKWVSPKGGIWCSLILRPNIPPIEAPKVTQIAAAAVYKALEDFNIKTTIKWPNDIHIDGQKLCGILVEMKGDMNSVDYLVVGAGINVNINSDFFDDSLADIATSLKIKFNKDFNRNEILASYLNHFEELYLDFLNNLDLKRTIDICRANSSIFGKKAKLITYNNEEIVTCLSLSDTGNLIVKDSNGNEKTVLSGEITFNGLKDS
ncbi:MAG: biotin--[acetyl-CoA-carboxylase] ligase [Clostridium butyricum]|nr:biotin--[acetyl-CoA-carboxylase] ligase [Clostridium butyricum]